MILVLNKYLVIIYLLTLLISSPLFPQDFSSRFEQLSKQEGLSQNEVYSILQDSKGFIWFATQNGLNKYDGYNIKIFTHEPGNNQSISGYAVNSLLEDRDGFIWIATREGLDRFDPKKETYRHYFYDENNPSSLPDNFCWNIFQDPSGSIFIGTKEGLCKYNPKEDNFIRYNIASDEYKSNRNNFINCLTGDEEGNIWIGTNHGLYLYSENRFSRFANEPDNKSSISDNRIISLYVDQKNQLWVGTFNGLNLISRSNKGVIRFKRYLDLEQPLDRFKVNIIRAITSDQEGNIWIGTMGKGLMKLNPNTDLITRLSSDQTSGQFFNIDEIASLFRDKTGVIWIGTYGFGVFKYNPTIERFAHFTHHKDLPGSLPNKNVRTIFEDRNGWVWIGTEGGGISKSSFKDLMKGKEKFVSIKGGSSEKSIYDVNNITDIKQDKDGFIWYSSFGGGITRYDPKTNIAKTYRYNKDNINSLSNDFVHTIHFDDNGILWIGTGMGGLNRFDSKQEKFKRYLPEPGNKNSLLTNEVSAIESDRDGNLWLGTTTKGLEKFDPTKEDFTHFIHDSEDASSISSNRILCIFNDSKNNVWIGTIGGGLNRYVREKNSFIHLMIEDGLPGNSIFGITEDSNYNLWITTDNGLAKYNPESGEIKNYFQSDGLQGNLFNPNAIFRNKETGYIFIGGTNGFNVFHPDRLNTPGKKPQIVITSFKIFNEEVPVRYYPKNPDIESPLEENVTYTKEISLSYQQNVFSFEFAALDYGNPRNNQYAYMMEGFDTDWIYSGNRRFVTYTNLDPGNYVFRVKGSNSEGNWNNEGADLSIIIDPPLWQTWWAYLIYAGLIILAFFGFRRYELDRIKLKNELIRKDFETKKMQEVDELKSKFFANISHEFRTPLTLILGITKKISENKNRNSIDQDLSILTRNSRRLLKLINQLLELSKIQSGNVKLNLQKTGVMKLTMRITASFISSAEAKNIKLLFNEEPIQNNTETKECDMYIDQEKMETVIYNLVSNAIKFTPSNSTVSINIEESQTDILLKVRNTGTGIREEDLQKIFDRFHQIKESGNNSYEGTGIGLALVKELIELHHGTVRAESDGKNFVEVIVNLKKGMEHFEKSDVSETGEIISSKLIEEAPLNEIPVETKVAVESDEVKGDNNPVLLVIEDNTDLRNYIAETVSDGYDVITAEDGEKGFEAAIQFVPDLIISDIMMPNMNGYELCKKLKGHQNTDHIPVILLTAKAETENKLEGLETGADDYLIKPFNKDELLVRVKNLISIRKRMREKYQSELTIKPAEVIVPSTQKIFIDKLIGVIESNIANEKFSIDELCNEIGMSRAQLHRKIKAITNQSTTEFIRNFRLQRAAELIKQGAGNMSEVAYMVGFNSQAYFNRSFQEFFNCSPGEYKKKNSHA